MSESNNNDMDRYFNDPDYRRNKMETENTQKQRHWYSRFNNKYGYLFLTFVIIILLIVGFIFYLYQGIPSLKQLENPQMAQASLVVSQDGVILDSYYKTNRTNVPIEQISPYVIQALIATEDHRFYHHWGIDMIRTLAIPYHLLHGDVEGGSTITQQLARNLYKQIGRDVSIFIRKLREMITAVNIERHYTKPEIIDMYLNTVEYPNSAFGIEAAAERHYGKSAKNLTILQSAMMVGSLNAPYTYNPRLFPKQAKGRRNLVLHLMNKHGFISDSTYNEVRKKPIVLDYHPPSAPTFHGRYFGEYVRQKVTPWAKKHGYNLYTDGLVIHTTIDSRLQRYARKAVDAKIDSLQKIFIDEWTTNGGDYMDRYWNTFPTFLTSFIEQTDRYKNGFSRYNTDQRSVVLDSLMADSAFIHKVKHEKTKLDAAFVAINPNNGRIKAWIGGRDYGEVQFDHVYQAKRQTGSTFKPFVYTVAIDNGYKPYSKFSKEKPVFYSSTGKVWSPGGHIPEGPVMMTLRRGLAQSLNTVTVNMLPALAGAPGTHSLEALKPAARKIKQMASNFGIDMSGTKAYPSIALGTAEASLLEMVSAYSTFANEGVHVQPVAITRIDDKHGNIIKQFQPPSRQVVISPQTAYIMIDMLRSVIRGGKVWTGAGTYYGTGIRLQSVYRVNQDIAGKTGTTQDASACWFIATTPNLTMGALVDGQDRRIRWPDNSRTGQGAHTALPIVGRFIDLASSDPQTNWQKNSFVPPPGFVMPKPHEKNSWQNNTRINW